jgi:hypothetical protein
VGAVHGAPARPRPQLGCLFRTAQRQAWLLEREVRESSPLRSFEWEDVRQTVQGVSEDTAEIRGDVQDALSIIGKLPPRLQRIALLRGLGMRHADISDCGYGVEVLAGRLPGPFESATAEDVARRALIPPHVLTALQAELDEHAAATLRVPVAQLARARSSAVDSPRA